MLKYEIKNQTVHQIVKYRLIEGFYLIKITKQLIKKSLMNEIISPTKRDDAQIKQNKNYYIVTVHFKRYFTQTTILYYKLSYYISSDAEDCEILSKQLSPSSDTNEKITNASGGKDSKFFEKSSGRLFCQIWISWNFLHLKTRYQNTILIEQIRRALNNIQKIDYDRTFELTSFMLNPPEILKLKEPLFKLILLNDHKNLSNDDFNNEIMNETTSNVFKIGNSNFELNIRRNKGKIIFFET